MAANGYVVNKDVTVTWDGVSVRFARGTVIDSPAAGALVTALGANITALPSQQTTDMGGQATGPFIENTVGSGQQASYPSVYNSGQN